MVPPYFCLTRKRVDKVRFSEKVTYIPNREETCLTKININKLIGK